MSIRRLTASVSNVQALADRPNADDGLTAAALKAVFDKAGEDIKEFINGSLIPDITGDNVPLGTPVPNVDADTLRGAIAALRAVVDQTAQGAIADGSVTWEKLDDALKRREEALRGRVSALETGPARLIFSKAADIPAGGGSVDISDCSLASVSKRTVLLFTGTAAPDLTSSVGLRLVDGDGADMGRIGYIRFALGGMTDTASVALTRCADGGLICEYVAKNAEGYNSYALAGRYFLEGADLADAASIAFDGPFCGTVRCYEC